MASWEEPPLPRSFDSVFYGAAGGGEDLPSDDQFNRVSFLSHFDGANNGVNNAFDDGSASNHTVTANGNVTQGSFGPFARPDGEWGVAFDGDDYLSVPDSVDWDFGTGDFTVEGWVNPASDLASDTQFIGFGDGDNGGNFGFEATGKPYFYHGGYYARTNTALTLVSWSHIAFVRSSGNLSCFINGTSAASSSYTGNVGGSLAPRIGAYSGGQYFKGYMSNVRIVKGTAVYTGNFTPSTSKLTAITNTVLLTCQSNRFIDNSASAHTLTPAGNPAVSAFGPFLTSAVYDAAVNGASAYFDGTDDLTIPTSSDFNLSNNPFTFSFWANFSSGGTVYGRYNYPSSQRETFISCYDTGVITVRVSPNGTGYYTHSTASGVFGFNQWNYIVITRTIDGSDSIFKTYVNGTLSATSTFAMTTIYYASQTTYIMNYGAVAERPTGYLCDFKLVNGTATAADSSNPTAPATNTTNTKLLLNMADGQVFDSAAQAEWTGTTVANGTPKLQTGQKKIGTSSLYFDGSSNYYFPNGFLPGGTGDFTIEFWLRASNTNDNATILTAGGIYFQFYQNKLRYFPYNGGAYIDSSTISTNTWYHVAGVRSGTTFYYFLDGTSQGTLTSVTAAVSNGAGYFGMNGSYPYTGYIDEMRISRMARYTSNFTPDTEPFADKGK